MWHIAMLVGIVVGILGRLVVGTLLRQLKRIFVAALLFDVVHMIADKRRIVVSIFTHVCQRERERERIPVKISLVMGDKSEASQVG